MRSLLGIVLGFSLLFAVDMSPGNGDGWKTVRTAMEVSALGALIAAYGYMLKFELPALRKERAEIREGFQATLNRITRQWDDWEKIRHADHENAQAVLRNLTKHCAEVWGKVRHNDAPPSEPVAK